MNVSYFYRIAANRFAQSTLVFLLAPAALWASEYRLDSSYALNGTYDDGIVTTSGDDLTGAELRATWNASRRNLRGQQAIDLNVRESIYSESAYSRTNGRAGLSANRSWERGTVNFSVSSAKNSVRTTQLEQFGAEQFLVLDSSRVNSDQLNLGATYVVTEVDTIQFTLFGQDQRYDADFFSDYEYYSGSSLYRRAINGRFSVQFDVSWSRLDSKPTDQLIRNPSLGFAAFTSPCFEALQNRTFTAQDPDLGIDCLKLQSGRNEQETTSYRVGMTYLVTERITLDLLAGPRDTVTDSSFDFLDVQGAPVGDAVAAVVLDSQRSDGLSFDVNIVYDNDSSDFEISARSSENVTSGGILNQTDRYEIQYNRAQTDRLRWGLGFTFIETERLNEADVVLFSRQNYRARIFGSYRMTEDWTLSGRFTTDLQDNVGSEDTSTRNIGSLTLSWQPKAFAF